VVLKVDDHGHFLQIKVSKELGQSAEVPCQST
jgi:hypothetical protein